jgi:hypothetical protein
MYFSWYFRRSTWTTRLIFLHLTIWKYIKKSADYDALPYEFFSILVLLFTFSESFTTPSTYFISLGWKTNFDSHRDLYSVYLYFFARLDERFAPVQLLHFLRRKFQLKFTFLINVKWSTENLHNKQRLWLFCVFVYAVRYFIFIALMKWTGTKTQVQQDAAWWLQVLYFPVTCVSITYVQHQFY